MPENRMNIFEIVLLVVGIGAAVLGFNLINQVYRTESGQPENRSALQLQGLHSKKYTHRAHCPLRFFYSNPRLDTVLYSWAGCVTL